MGSGGLGYLDVGVAECWVHHLALTLPEGTARVHKPISEEGEVEALHGSLGIHVGRRRQHLLSCIYGGGRGGGSQ